MKRRFDEQKSVRCRPLATALAALLALLLLCAVSPAAPTIRKKSRPKRRPETAEETGTAEETTQTEESDTVTATVETEPGKGEALPAGKDEKPPSPAKENDKKVSPAEQLGFQQAEVTAEMAELEQRMFRLGETLKSLEPENSSRLMLGLKFAREELVLHQMKAVQEQLQKASLGESLIEQKQLLGKLERLEQLLLSADLDFQMRLERLRQIREILRRLDPIIREEDREQKLSDQTAAREAKAAEFAGVARSSKS